MSLADLLAQYDRLAIGGAGDTGKTTLAGQVTDRVVIHTDDWLTGDKQLDKHRFPLIPALVKVACEEHARFAVEGTRAVGVLSAGLDVDALLWLTVPRVGRNARQESAALGRQTDFERWLAESDGPPVFTFADGGELVRVR